MAFTAITPGQVDADSPVDSVLMGLLRTNLDDHETRIDAAFTLSSPVPQGGLDTALQSGTIQSASVSTIVLSGGSYHFLMGGGGTNASSTLQLEQPETVNSVFAIGDTSGVVYRFRVVSNAGFQSQWATRYIQASPPYKLGGVEWNHFFFILRSKVSGDVIATCESPDPCWHNNGRLDLPKDHPDKIAAVPHPFADYWQKDPAADGLEIVLLDMRSQNLGLWHKENDKLGRNISQDLNIFLPSKGKIETHSEIGIGGLAAFESKVKIITP